MGLFDFLKHGEHKTYNDSLAETQLKQAVEALNLGIKDLQISYHDGLATIRGVAPTQKDLEIARLTVGNHEGVHKVNDDGLTVAQPTGASATTTAAASAAPEQQPGRMYTVKAGDTLSKIAKEELGDADKYPQLFDANKPMLKDPNKIYPGQVLRVPTLQPSHA